MYYCKKCRINNNWPQTLATSHGRCEICGDTANCNYISSSMLPIVVIEDNDD